MVMGHYNPPDANQQPKLFNLDIIPVMLVESHTDFPVLRRHTICCLGGVRKLQAMCWVNQATGEHTLDSGTAISCEACLL